MKCSTVAHVSVRESVCVCVCVCVCVSMVIRGKPWSR